MEVSKYTGIPWIYGIIYALLNLGAGISREVNWTLPIWNLNIEQSIEHLQRIEYIHSSKRHCPDSPATRLFCFFSFPCLPGFWNSLCSSPFPSLSLLSFPWSVKSWCLVNKLPWFNLFRIIWFAGNQRGLLTSKKKAAQWYKFTQGTTRGIPNPVQRGVVTLPSWTVHFKIFVNLIYTWNTYNCFH